MKKAALTHPKMYALASRLGCPLPHAAGIIEYLRAFTGDHAPRGDVGKWPDGAIAVACHWTGDAGDFIKALVETRWLDPCQVHRLVVHDWKDHCESWVKAKLAEMRLAGLESDFAVPTPVGTSSPNLSSPSLTEPNLSNGFTKVKPSSGKPDRSNDVRQVFEHYRTYHSKAHPRPRSKMKEWKLILDRFEEGYSVADLCAAIDGCHRTPWNTGENPGSKQFTDLELIVRNSDKVSRFMEAPIRAGPVLSEKTQRTLRAAESWASREEGHGNDDSNAQKLPN